MEEKLGPWDFLRANADFERRAESLKVTVTYDDEFDIFLLALGEPQQAITEELGDGLQVRLDPTSLKIVGFEILCFEQRYLKTHPQFRPHFEALFEKPPIRRRDIPARTKQRRRAQDAVRQLVALPC
jgi:uncharacterized protein YuzE